MLLCCCAVADARATAAVIFHIATVNIAHADTAVLLHESVTDTTVCIWCCCYCWYGCGYNTALVVMLVFVYIVPDAAIATPTAPADAYDASNCCCLILVMLSIKPLFLLLDQ